MMKKQAKKSKKGFTLIELVVVIAILGILAAILIPVIGGFIENANKAADEANARSLYNSVAMYLAVDGDLADTSGALEEPALTQVGLMFGVGILNADNHTVTVDADNAVTEVWFQDRSTAGATYPADD